MLRFIMLSVCGVLSVWNATAQDVILKRNAEEIQAVVTEIGDTEVKYKKFAAPQGVTYVISKSDIFSITYQNGSKEHFAAQPKHKEGDYPYPKISKTYKVGDLFEEGKLRGLVVRTTDNGRHGLILSFEEGEHLCWGGVWGEDYVESFQGFDCHCTDAEDGWKNMQAIADMIQHTTLTWANFPAFQWCRNLGEGWYLPAINEIGPLLAYPSDKPLNKIGLKEYRAHKAAVRLLSQYLEQCGESPLSTTMSTYSCWYSTELKVERENPYNWKIAKTRVRAFHKF
ncbi:MAG: hypothetical protein RR182_08730 [Alistipes sp.]